MARCRPRRDVAVKLETLIQGRAGTISIVPLPHGRGSETPGAETSDAGTPILNRDREGAAVASFRYQREDGRLVEGEFSIEALDRGAWSVLIGGRAYRIEPGGRIGDGELIVNGVPLAVELFDPRESRQRRGSAASHGRLNITAPMPGKVVRLLASAGDAVEQGDGLVVVEAMKMQNEMKSPKTGRVVEVRTKPNSAVAAGEVLMVVE
jgi:acetyl/propionyl-CoA carboxylase alpha subunit